MEKYGVYTNLPNEKTAGQEQSCPRCGSTNLHKGITIKCPNCGTAPFENRRNNQNAQKEKNASRRRNF